MDTLVSQQGHRVTARLPVPPGWAGRRLTSEDKAIAAFAVT